MRIQPKDLETHIKRLGLAPLYFIFGDEALQLKEALDFIRSTAKNQGYAEHQIFEINAHFDWNVFKEAFSTESLFSSKRILECRLLDNKLGGTGAEVIKKYTLSIPKDIILLITASKIEATTQKTQWFSAIEKFGVTVQTRPLIGNEMLDWLVKRMRNAQLQATPEVIHALFERTEGNLLAAAQAIEKLTLLCDKNSVTLNDVIEASSMNARFSLFDLMDAIASGVIPRTLKIFSYLKKEAVEPVLILWAITREIRVMIHIAYALEQGELKPRLSDILTEQGVWKRRENIVTTFLKRFSFKEFQKFLQQAKNIDDRLKNRIPGDAWPALWILCLTLAGGYRE